MDGLKATQANLGLHSLTVGRFGAWLELSKQRLERASEPMGYAAQKALCSRTAALPVFHSGVIQYRQGRRDISCLACIKTGLYGKTNLCPHFCQCGMQSNVHDEEVQYKDRGQDEREDENENSEDIKDKKL